MTCHVAAADNIQQTDLINFHVKKSKIILEVIIFGKSVFKESARYFYITTGNLCLLGKMNLNTILHKMFSS